MLSRGKINAEEAEKLLDAVELDSLSQKKKPEKIPRYLYVRVDPEDGSDNRDQVKVTVPLAPINACLNFASLLPQEAREEVEKTKVLILISRISKRVMLILFSSL